MLQVLLADDEIAVTNSLRQGIDWKSMNMTVAAVTTSGSQALSYILSHHVDVLISDIRMADMDGLSLCQKISQMRLGIQTILISGFAEFSYAQKALTYGVIGYCLKPIEYGELTRYLHLAVRNLGIKSRNSMQDDLLDALYRGHVKESRDYLQEFGFQRDGYYVAVSVGRHPLRLSDTTTLTVQVGHKRYLYISTEAFPIDIIDDRIRKEEYSGFCYSTEPIGLQKMGAAIKRQNYEVFSFFFLPRQKLFPDSPHRRCLLHTQDIADILEHSTLPQLLQKLQQLRETDPRQLSTSYAWHLYNSLANDRHYGALVSTDNIYTPEQMVFQFETFQNMIDELCLRLEGYAPVHSQNNISNSAFLQMVEYIDSNLDKTCSLQQLSKEMKMNANYLGQVFKRETGETFSAYVTELRIERAKQMLQDEDVSIGEVSTALGFNDYFYFLKTFKRVTGITPKQYRQQLENG